jgi:hypothetical protein
MRVDDLAPAADEAVQNLTILLRCEAARSLVNEKNKTAPIVATAIFTLFTRPSSLHCARK